MGNNFLIRQEPMPRYDVVLARLEPKDNTLPGLIFGIQAAIGTVWWFCIMLVYIKNRASDADLRTVLGVPAFPVSWWWERLTRDGDTANWLSWSLLTGFITYFMVSVMEFIAYIFYETGNLGVALWYYRTIGYWGSTIAYSVPFILSIIQVGVQGTDEFPGTWSIFTLCFFGAQWVMDGLIHIFYIEDFMAHIAA